jgi:hypothetical protein
MPQAPYVLCGDLCRCHMLKPCAPHCMMSVTSLFYISLSTVRMFAADSLLGFAAAVNGK